MPKHRGEQILARFPGPVTVTPVLTLSRGFFITSLTLLAIGSLWMGGWQYLEDPDSDWGPGVGFGAIFAFISVASVAVLRINRMTLDREGFELVQGSIWGTQKKRFPWRELSAFEVVHVGRARGGSYVVSFDDARKKGGGMLSAVGRTLGYRNSTLFEDYGLAADEFAELLNQWRYRALADASGDRGPTAS